MKTFSRFFSAIFFVVLLLTSTFPSMLHLDTQLMGDGIDNYEFIGFQHLVRDRLARFQYPFTWTDYLRYPIGFDIGKGFDGLYAAITGGLLGYITTPTIAFNFTVYSIYLLNYLSGYLLFKKISSSNLIASLSAGIFAFSNYALARNGSHINLTLIAGFPLTFYALVRLKEKITPFTLSIFGIGIILTSIGSLQYLLILGLIFLVFLVLSLALYPIELFRYLKSVAAHWKSLAIFLLALIILGIALHFSYFKSFISGTYALRDRQEAFDLIKSGFSDLFIPNSYLRQWFVPFFQSAHLPSIESAYFLGFIEIILLIAAMFSKIRRKTKVFWGSGILIFSLLTIKGVYRHLLPIFPFSAIPEPGRFVIPILLSLTIMIASFLSSVRHSKKFIFAILLTSLLFIVSKLTFNFYQSPDLEDPSNQIIRSLPGQAVLDLPFATFETKRHQQVFQRGKKALDGYVHWSADDPITRSFIDTYKLDDYACSKTNSPKPLNLEESERNKIFLLDTLKSYDIRGLVIHKDSKLLYTECQAARSLIEQLIPNQVNITDTGEKVVTLFHENPAAPYVLETYFFPNSGTLNLNGALIYPTNIEPPKIMLDGIVTGYSWEPNQDGLNLTPKDTLQFKIKAGSTLTIYSSTPLFITTYTTVWYSFKAEESSPTIKPRVEKVFDDSTTAVYRLN